MSTLKCRSWFLNAFSVTILLLSRTAARLRRYPAGSSCGSGGRGISTLERGTGENGVMGVPGVTLLPPEVRFIPPILLVMKGGDLTLEFPEARLELDGAVSIEGLPSDFSVFLREKSPILVG